MICNDGLDVEDEKERNTDNWTEQLDNDGCNDMEKWIGGSDKRNL